MTQQPLGSTMRVFRPFPHIMAFYDGRIEGRRAWSDEPNWLDDGAYALGACSYAIIDGSEALVYDTHMSLNHATVIRRTLQDAGVRSMRVVLSHWHADHVAGNGVFSDCAIIANALTICALEEQRGALEHGTPPIRPLVLPTQSFAESLSLKVGSIAVALHRYDIHSQDGTVLVLPETGIILAGDTLEDPITYVTEPDRLEHHLVELDRLQTLPIRRILPNHGSAAVIESGGYGTGLLDANRRYIQKLLRCVREPDLARDDLRTFLGSDLDQGVSYFGAYQPVHRQNVQRVLLRQNHV